MKVQQGIPQNPSDATADESTAIRIPQMQLLLNLWHFLPQ